MKAKIIPILTTCFFFLILCFSCEDATYKVYQGNEPIYLSYNNLRTGVTSGQITDLRNAGKMYFKDNYIFVVEELQGIHVYDNSDPSSPVNKSFIKVPGVVDIVISGNVMYADSYVDLVVLDLSDLSNIKEIGRINDIILYTVPPTGNNFPMASVDREKGVVTGWKVKTIRERVNTQPIVYPVYTFDLSSVYTLTSSSSGGLSGTGIGIGGSMARFGIRDNILYLLVNNSLKILDITSKSNPQQINELYPGSGIETMFLTDKNMFLGTTTGMIIYNITVPTAPTSKVAFSHARSCDPVVVDDTLAYITLRSGTTCGGSTNSLDIVNIKDISHPVVVTSYAMTNPHGLGKSGKLLFVCDGSAGLKIFDASDPKQLLNRALRAYPGINATDVIPTGSVLIMIGDDGLYQYNYSDIQNIRLLSKIEILKAFD